MQFLEEVLSARLVTSGTEGGCVCEIPRRRLPEGWPVIMHDSGRVNVLEADVAVSDDQGDEGAVQQRAERAGGEGGDGQGEEGNGNQSIMPSHQ